MEVREGMSSVVLAVGPGHTLRETATKMTEKGTGAALVFDDESPAPRIITERDILNAVGTGKDPDVEKVADHMSESVISAEPSWSLEQAAEEMVQRRYPPPRCGGAWRAGRRALDARHRALLDAGRPTSSMSPP